MKCMCIGQLFKFQFKVNVAKAGNLYYYVFHLSYHFFPGCDESKKTSHQDGSCCERHLRIVLDAKPVHLFVQLLHSFTEIWKCHLYSFYCPRVMQFHSESFHLRFREPEIST